MVEITSVSPHELKAMCAGAAEPWLREHADTIEECAAYGPEWIMRNDGVPVMAGGFMEFEFGAALAWAIVDKDASHLGLTVTRTCRRYLKQAPYRWIEAQVTDGFVLSLRWVRLIGFRPIGEFHTVDGVRLHRFVFKG